LRGNTGADADEYFNGWTGIEEIELRGGGAATEFTAGVAGTMEVTLDDDANTTGVNRVVLSKGTGVVGAVGANAVVDLALGVDFERALTIDLAEGSTITVDNDANVALTVNVDARTAPVVAGGTAGAATINFTDAGTGAVALNIRVDDVAQTIGQAATDVVITNADATAEIDSITLLDSNTVSATNVAPAGNQLVASEDQTGVIRLTTHSSWAQAGDTLRIDASDINDDDRTDGGVLTNTDDQTVTINAGGAGIAYAVNVTGSQMVDTITGTAQGDTIDGQAGNDTIIGGVGADTLTGGAGVDTFVYTAVGDSRGVSGVDTITDFVTGTDKLQIAVNVDQNIVDTVNLARFNNAAATVGSALVELDGAPATRIIDAGYSTDGKYFIDLDGDGNINNTTDLRIDIANTVNAGDINYRVTLTFDGNNDDVVRGGQGADAIQGSADADVFVMVGSITSAQANAYLAAETAVPNSVIPAALANVLDISELTTVRTQSEVNAGDQLNAAGADVFDTLHIYGTANLANINNGGALNVGTLVVHSSVTLTLTQLATIGTLQFSGNEPHSITIVNDNGTPLNADPALNQAAQVAALAAAAASISIANSGPNTTLTVGTGSTQTVAAFVTAYAGATVDAPTITSAMSAADIATTLATATNALVVATGMSADQLAAVVAGNASIAAAGVSGTLTLNQADLTTLGLAKVNASAVLTLADAGGSFVEADAANVKVNVVDVTSGTLVSTNLANATAIGAKLAAADTQRLNVLDATIESYTAANFTALNTAKVATLQDTNDTTLTLASDRVAALGTIALLDSGNDALNVLVATGTSADLGALVDTLAEVNTLKARATAVQLDSANANTLTVTQTVANLVEDNSANIVMDWGRLAGRDGSNWRAGQLQRPGFRWWYVRLHRRGRCGTDGYSGTGG